MVETPPADAGDTGATPDPGTEEQPCPCTRDPPPQAAREAATARSLCRLQREQPLIAAAGGKPCSREDQHSQNQTNDFYRGTGLEMVKYSGR